jgi:hypothetical protein
VLDEKDETVVLPRNLETGKALGGPVRLTRVPERVISCSGHEDGRIAIGLVNGDSTAFLVWNPKLGSAAPQRLEVQNVSSCKLGSEGFLWTLADTGLAQRWNMENGNLERTLGGAELLATVTTPLGVMYTAISVPNQGAIVKSIGPLGPAMHNLAGTNGVQQALFINDRQLAVLVRGKDRDQLTTCATPFICADPVAMDTAPSRITVLATDDKRLVTGHEDGVIEIWRPLVKKPAHVLPGHGAAARFVAFDEQRKWMATSYADGTVNVWDSTRLLTEPLVRLSTRTRSSGAPTIAFEPGNPAPALLVGSVDGEVWRWTLGSESILPTGN